MGCAFMHRAQRHCHRRVGGAHPSLQMQGTRIRQASVPGRRRGGPALGNSYPTNSTPFILFPLPPSHPFNVHTSACAPRWLTHSLIRGGNRQAERRPARRAPRFASRRSFPRRTCLTDPRPSDFPPSNSTVK